MSSMVVVCRGCGARFRMTHALFQDAKGARIRCRKCGGYIEVRHPEASPPPPAPGVPSALRYDPAPTAFPEILEVVPGEGPVTAPVASGDTVPEEESEHARHAPWMEAVPPMDAPDAAPAINCNRGGVNLKTYAVYRIGYWNNKLELLGKVVERRKEERKNNAADMLRWAQKIYAASSIDSSIFIVKEGSSEGPIFGGA